MSLHLQANLPSTNGEWGATPGDPNVVELTTQSGETTHMWCCEPELLRSTDVDVTDTVLVAMRRSMRKAKVAVPEAFPKPTIDILYTHGRLEDISFRAVRRFLAMLAIQFNVNCYIFEWPGFHFSTGSPTPDSIVEAGEAAFKYLCDKNSNGIILMGHSIGCGAVLQMATSGIAPASGLLRGVAMRAPMTSVCGILCPSSMCCCCAEAAHRSCCRCGGWRALADSCDAVRNIDLIEHVACPVFIMHSKADELIPYQHSQLLAAECEDCTLWWMEREPPYKHPDHPTKGARLHPEFVQLFAAFLDRCGGALEGSGLASAEVKFTVSDEASGEVEAPEHRGFGRRLSSEGASAHHEMGGTAGSSTVDVGEETSLLHNKLH